MGDATPLEVEEGIEPEINKMERGSLLSSMVICWFSEADKTHRKSNPYPVGTLIMKHFDNQDFADRKILLKLTGNMEEPGIAVEEVTVDTEGYITTGEV